MRRSRAPTMSGLLSRMMRKRRGTGRVTSRSYKRPRVMSRVGGRRRAVTASRNRRRRNYLPSNNEELNQSNRNSGRRLRFSTKFTRKYVRKQTELQKYRFGQISNYGGLTGPLIFPNFQTGNGATKQAPCTLIDLCGTYNLDGNSLITPQTTWNINFTDETGSGSVQFVPATAGWQLAPLDISGGQNTVVSYAPKKQDFLKWVKINLLFYTPLSIPTKISVQMVQFKDPRFVPLGTTYPQTTETATFNPATAFWRNYLKDYMYNPISPSSGVDMSKWMKVLHSDTFILNPKDTDETSNTRYKIHKIFKNFNRFQNYAYETNYDSVNLDSVDLPVRTGENDVTVHPRARVYLIIRAMSVEQQAETYPPANWWNLWPSADIYVETCHMNSS